MADPCCLVLGADSDIGRSLALQFALHGFDLYLTTRKKESIDRSWTNTLEGDCQIKIDWFYLEGLDFDTHRSFYQKLPAPPSVVISAMGYLGNHETAKVDFKEALKIIQCNFTIQVSILNIVADDMEQRKKGVIIGITSVAGERGRKSNYYYGSAKAAFTTYLSGLRNRLFNSGVHVMTVKPGYIRTKMTQDTRLPKYLTTDPNRLAKRVYRAYITERNIVYYLPVWRWIMLLIKYMPESIFKRLDL